eukprot:1157362-Pelagomonas_calceolata.AAC.7
MPGSIAAGSRVRKAPSFLRVFSATVSSSSPSSPSSSYTTVMHVPLSGATIIMHQHVSFCEHTTVSSSCISTNLHASTAEPQQ